MPAGFAGWLPAQEHHGENIGETATHVVFVELKEPWHPPAREPRARSDPTRAEPTLAGATRDGDGPRQNRPPVMAASAGTARLAAPPSGACCRHRHNTASRWSASRRSEASSPDGLTEIEQRTAE